MESCEAKILILLASEPPRGESTLNNTLDQARGPEHNLARLWEGKKLRKEGFEQLSSITELMIRFINLKRVLCARAFRIDLLHARRCSNGWRRSKDWTGNYFQISQSFQSYHQLSWWSAWPHLPLHRVGNRRPGSTILWEPNWSWRLPLQITRPKSFEYNYVNYPTLHHKADWQYQPNIYRCYTWGRYSFVSAVAMRQL